MCALGIEFLSKVRAPKALFPVALSDYLYFGWAEL